MYLIQNGLAMSLPFLPIGGGKQARGEQEEQWNPIKNADGLELFNIVKHLINRASDDLCGNVKRLAKARDTLTTETTEGFWMAACHAVGISNEFKERHREYEKFKWESLFKLFCSYEYEYVCEDYDDLNDRTTKQQRSATWAEKRKLYFDALQSGQFYEACLALRSSDVGSIHTKLLIFHTGGAYRWFPMETWKMFDRIVSNIESLWKPVFADQTARYMVTLHSEFGWQTPLEAYTNIIAKLGVDLNNKLGKLRFAPVWRARVVETGLMNAVVTGDDEIFQLLIQNPNIDVDVVGFTSTWTALTWALSLHRLHMVAALLDKNARVAMYDFYVARDIQDPGLKQKLRDNFRR